MKGDKLKIIYVCSNCGNVQPKWSGRCPECGEWNTIVEEKVVKKSSVTSYSTQKEVVALTGKEILLHDRLAVGIEEFDRVLGGGFVKGSVVLLAGEPGIGKSTIVMQMLARLEGRKKLYVSGEESESQLQMRAKRLKISDDKFFVLTENNLEEIVAHIEKAEPELIAIDSIQTLFSNEYENVPGSVTQVRECAGKLLKVAKEKGSIIIFIGHITKEGLIAGPKVLEHLVDAVLYLEGGRQDFYRTLRAVKNRFGSTNEIGVFEMQESGLIPVTNPHLFFIAERRKHVSGSAIAVCMEGTRPLLVESQALVTQTVFGTPQRNANGIEYKRFMMLLAVTERRGELPLRTQDVFINLAGGIQVNETAIDLSIVAAVASSFRDVPLNPEAVFIGEVGLVGEVRNVPFLETRLKEAKKLGFKEFFVPKNGLDLLPGNLKPGVHGIDSISQLLREIL